MPEFWEAWLATFLIRGSGCIVEKRVNNERLDVHQDALPVYLLGLGSYVEISQTQQNVHFRQNPPFHIDILSDGVGACRNMLCKSTALWRA